MCVNEDMVRTIGPCKQPTVKVIAEYGQTPDASARLRRAYEIVLLAASQREERQNTLSAGESSQQVRGDA